jgi:flagellar basal body-associated protein FliL
MNAARWSVSLVAIIGVFAATVAGAIVWLLFTDPVTVANSVSSGDVAPVVQAIGAVIVNALRGLFKYL